MNKKEKDLLTFLIRYSNQWVSSTQLADLFQCTTRTIRNRVSSINSKSPKTILASSKGYQINAMKQEHNVDLASHDRKAKILTALLKHSDSGINLFDLAESLFVSESTIKSDIQYLKKKIESDKLTITMKDNLIKLEGSERSKRQFMISIIYDERSIHDNMKSSIQKMIGYISLDDLSWSVRKILDDEQVKIDQYTMTNIVLHFAISIERIRQGQVLHSKELKKSGRTEEYYLAKRIALKLEKKYAIHFTKGELQQLSTLFIGLNNEKKYNNQEQDLTMIVDKQIIEVLKTVLVQVKKIYLIDFTKDPIFFSRLAIHIQSLYFRSKYNSFSRNSSLLDLKTVYPIIYEISVYISSFIQKSLAIWFTEDEIAFIALHIGAFVNESKTTTTKLAILLIKSNYHDLTDNIYLDLLAVLGGKVTIDVVDEWEAIFENYDIILTTDRNLTSKYTDSVYIHPFLTNKDIKKIENRISIVQFQKQKKIMYAYIDRFIPKYLYHNQIDISMITAKDIQTQLFETMKKKKYISNSFIESVEKREHIAPTDFPSGIAVPHSLERQALKTGISIVTMQKPLIWYAYPVKVIALVAINQKDAKDFNIFFEKFIEIVSDELNTHQLSQAVDYEDFISRLKSMIINYE